jgi:hypothetical protein
VVRARVLSQTAGGERSPWGTESTLRIFADHWELVVAAKGQSDERDAQGVPRRGDRGGRGLHDADGCDGTKESTAAADLDDKTPILAAQILVEMPEDRTYDDIASAGNALLDELEVDGAQFIEAACHGSVGETADCTALS